MLCIFPCMFAQSCFNSEGKTLLSGMDVRQLLPFPCLILLEPPYHRLECCCLVLQKEKIGSGTNDQGNGILFKCHKIYTSIILDQKIYLNKCVVPLINTSFQIIFGMPNWPFAHLLSFTTTPIY